MGGLIPRKSQDYNGWSSELSDNSSLVFFYDDDKLRKCPQRNGNAAVGCDKNAIVVLG